MGNSERSDPVLALGRKLVEQLGLDNSVDTLGRWMAHHIAELITKAESAKGQEKTLAEKTCFEAILTLWKHRSELPNGKRPFAELEPIIRIIGSLDAEDDTPRYFRAAQLAAAERKEQTSSDAWLDVVSGLDYSAKVLIRSCLAEAAHAAVDKSEEWVNLAAAAGADEGVTEIVIRFLSPDTNPNEKSDQNFDVRQKLEGRLKRLDAFAKLAEGIASDWRGQLEALSPPPNGADGARQPSSKRRPIRPKAGKG